ncbi:periplasmic cytochrome c [Sulfurimonas gotlandica GD1]|uniref:Periplasmic cytochrome c n=1 Tax=Sulfurimonas gotlandica (strain DSM 19862 / JCM 16533 / GD1) TaxID=929558 RepID=B6BLB8_SULGG|nr:c-type cytochrome [Sulfurimonas gotlandica]EDZ62156.1 cytochrome c, class I [Sulfurimonas gotlandica GD1]EHP28572.1 periplasmic cytochrome c [Sulfurimonas gotlandica GD1]
MRFLLLILLTFTLSYASSSYELGKKLYMEKGCFSCHGSKLEGMHMYPRLANRARGFLTYKLKRFRDKKSDNQQQEMMIAFATSLSDADIENLVTYMTDYVEDKNGERYDDTYHTHGDGGS